MSIKKKTYWKKIKLLDNFFLKKLYQNRLKIDKILKKLILINKTKLILDIGASPSKEKFDNVFIQNLKYKKNLTVLSNVDCNILKKKFPKIKVLIRNGINTSLKDRSFDIVHSSATIEHVGSEKNQIDFIKECSRISKNQTVIITPNRNFFIDFHTKIPLLHLLPKNLHRNLLCFFGDSFFSKEKNLNLLNTNDIKKFCKILKINNYQIIYHYFLFMRSNIILLINKNKGR